MGNNPTYQQQADLIHRTFGIPVVAYGLDGGTVESRGTAGHRSLSRIAAEIGGYWTDPYFGAVPYIEAMADLDQITDRYYGDTAEDVVRYFLANATSWRGEHARRIKAELKDILKGVGR
jgi:hypothetical protein